MLSSHGQHIGGAHTGPRRWQAARLPGTPARSTKAGGGPVLARRPSERWPLQRPSPRLEACAFLGIQAYFPSLMAWRGTTSKNRRRSSTVTAMLKTLTREDAVITGFQGTQNKRVTKAGGGGGSHSDTDMAGPGLHLAWCRSEKSPFHLFYLAASLPASGFSHPALQQH